MPIQHTVVFRLAHDEGSPEADRFLADGQSTLAAIPGVNDFAVQRQVSPKSDLTHQFTMNFADDAAYQAYNDHPDHVAFVADRWIAEVAAFQEFDFVRL